MPRRAWYIGCTEDEIGEAAILVGDRARIDRIAGHLEEPAFVVENRGLQDGHRAPLRQAGDGVRLRHGRPDRGNRVA